MKKYDLVVAGGGFAGTAAAIAAARQGISVLLIERSNCLGGAAVNCLVNPFMSNATKINLDGEPVQYPLSQGLFSEICDELKKMGAFSGELEFKKNNIFQEEYLKIVLNRMVIASGADLLYHTYLIDVKKEADKVVSVICANKSGKQEFFADYFIDATGDADLAFLSGCSYRLGREQDQLCQPMTLCFRVANVDIEKYKKAKPHINELYKKMQKEGKIKNIREDVLIFHNIVGNVLHFNSTRIIKRNPVDAFDLTKAEIEAREQVLELFTFLKENIKGFENSDLLMTAPQIGIRESRMIDGEYILTGDDLVACAKFSDSIALGNYDIDIHNPEGSGTSHYYFPEGQFYTIPYRSLVPRGSKNVLVAGRCISATHEAQASIRIMPIVCCLGQAAGVAAGIACKEKTDVGAVDVAALRQKLKEQGAVC